MSRAGRRTLFRALVAACALLASGCAVLPGAAPPAAPKGAPAGPAPPPAPAAPAAAVPPAPAATVMPRFPEPVSAQWITARIAELEATRKQGKSADPDGALALELALLHSHPGNPAPDHAKALAMMRDYLAVAPSKPHDPLLDHVAGLLEEIERMEAKARDARAREKELASQVHGLEQRVAEVEQHDATAKKREQELLGQIKTLQQQIEQLQKLDLEIERRRRSVR